MYWSIAGGIDKPENTVEPTAWPDAVPVAVVTAKAARSEAAINLDRLISMIIALEWRGEEPLLLAFAGRGAALAGLARLFARLCPPLRKKFGFLGRLLSQWPSKRRHLTLRNCRARGAASARLVA